MDSSDIERIKDQQIDIQNNVSQDNFESNRLYDGQHQQMTVARKQKSKFYLIAIAIIIIVVLILIMVTQISNDKYQTLQNEIRIFQKPVKQNLKFVATFLPTSSFLRLPSTFPSPGHIQNNNKVCLDTTKLQRALSRDIMAYEARQKYVCIDVNQKFDDYLNRQIYLMTAFNFFFQYCFDPNPYIGIIKESIQQRNKDRSNMQWALKNFKQGDNVLVIGSDNVLSFILMAKIIGNTGSLTLVGQFSLEENTCLKKNMNLHKLHNVRVARKLEGKNKYKGFSIILGKQKLIQQELILAQFMNKSLIKSFIWVNDSTYLNQYKDCCIITKYTFDAESCNEPQITKQIQGEGYYQIVNKKINRPYNTELIQYTEDSFLTPFFKRYNALKQQKVQTLRNRLSDVVKIRSECGCVNISEVQKIDNFSVSIYGEFLFGVDDSQVKVWGQQRQAVEWVRQKMQPTAVIYYELKDLNLLAIMQIARIINKGKLLILCQIFDCQWIDRQSFISNISNIQLVTIQCYDCAITSDAIITDNQQLIERAINDKYLSKCQILGYFTRERQISFKTFGKLLPTFNFKQIQLFNASQQCYGFKYTNYFWDIDYLNHFYQIQPTKYHIFMYWSVSPLTLSINRRNSIQQIIQTSKVQIKVFTRDLFCTVEGMVPIHQAFLYLSDVHQSDYFRIYMMHSFGGGYADIKHNHYDWRPYFEKLYANPDKYAMGYRERQPHHVACHEDIRLNSCYLIMMNFTKIIGNGAYIYKKNTILTQKAISMNHQTLDNKLQELKKYPANEPRDEVDKITIKNGIQYKSRYPIRWAELGGQVMSRVTFANLDYYLYDLPYFIAAIYQ